MFIDQAEIFVRAGKGGDGAMHFRREKFVSHGGPDGGNGGAGGSVILEVLPTLNTLSHFRQSTRYLAPDGRAGAKQDMTGRSGEDLLIQVPPGTLVYDATTGLLLGDLTTPGQRLEVAKGGKGGRGNARFANSVHQTPRFSERGEPGAERTLRLELKLIADVGIAGMPNAGKSTFLAVVTNAKPKIAAYPFTTLEPNLGVANLDYDTDLILADIPGLIEGAHLGVGLGHDFLRHIQRTRVLIHLLDGQNEDPLLDYNQINAELALFDPLLGAKPQVVVINKIDLPEVRDRLPALTAAFAARGVTPLAISAVTGEGVRPVLWAAHSLLASAPPPPVPESIPVYRPEADPQEFTLSREDDGSWRVSGAAIERAAAMTYWDQEQAVRRFQRILQTLGIEDALRADGIGPGDTVHIGEYELEWAD
jgi:GTP-binding protein